jgi:hypothetical protein
MARHMYCICNISQEYIRFCICTVYDLGDNLVRSEWHQVVMYQLMNFVYHKKCYINIWDSLLNRWYQRGQPLLHKDTHDNSRLES